MTYCSVNKTFYIVQLRYLSANEMHHSLCIAVLLLDLG